MQSVSDSLTACSVGSRQVNYCLLLGVFLLLLSDVMPVLLMESPVWWKEPVIGSSGLRE